MRYVGLDELKLTCFVESLGLNGSSIAFTGLSPIWDLVMAAAILSHAISAMDRYMICAGYVPPLHMRHWCIHCLTMCLSGPNRCRSGALPGSRHLCISKC